MATTWRLKLAYSLAVASGTAVLSACQHAGAPSTLQGPSAEEARTAATISADSGWAPYWSGPMLISPLEENGPSPLRIRRGPEYPAVERNEGQEATAMVAMIVDTSGRVIVPSLRFVRDAPPAFRRSICDFAWRATFTPARVNERVTAALVVMDFSFSLGGSPRLREPTVEVEKLLRSLPSKQRHAWLSKKPSC